VKRAVVLAAAVAAAAALVSAPGAEVTKLTLSLEESSAYSIVSGTTLYYAPTGSNSGSFTVTATAKADTSIDEVEFPAAFGADSFEDDTKPYSQTYSWTASSSETGSKTVTATETGGVNTKSAQFRIAPDKSPPTGQSVALSGRPAYSTLSVPLSLTNGTDDGAGVDPSSGVVERASAPLAQGTCGTFGPFAPVTVSGGVDASVATGNCYRYQYKVADKLGNLSAASPPSGDAKVDVTPPSTPGLSFSGLANAAAAGSVVYYRPGAGTSFTVAAASTDAESAVASYAFSAPAGLTPLGSGPSRTFSLPATATGLLGPLTVAATNGTGLASGPASFSLVPDAAPPTVSIRCNGRPCRTTAYPKAVTVTLAAADTGGSGVGTIRYTFDGTTPTLDHGAEYEGPFVVRTLTTVRVRVFDKVGNASRLVSARVRSLADRYVFAAPTRLRAAAHARFLTARLGSSRRAIASVSLAGPGLKHPHRWRFVLGSGTSIVQLRLPATRTGKYTLVWSMQAGSKKSRKTTVVVFR